MPACLPRGNENDGGVRKIERKRDGEYERCSSFLVVDEESEII